MRSAAITQSKIADVLKARGELDEALELQAERLEANRKLRDAEGIAAAQWGIARIELQREQHDRAIPRLLEAWGILERLGRTEGLAVVGRTLGQLLAGAGLRDEARAVLGISAGAWRKLGRGQEAEAVEALLGGLGE